LKSIRVPVAIVVLATTAFAGGNRNLKGTWAPIPAKSDFGGQAAIEKGVLSIVDSQGRIYISQNFTYDGANQMVAYNFATDGRENSAIQDGGISKIRAEWEGDVLKVATTRDNSIVTERFNLEPDGTLRLVVERPGHRTITLSFRQTTPVSSMLLIVFGSVIGSFGAVFLKLGASALKRNLRSLLTNWKLAAGVGAYLLSSVFYVLGVKHGELTVLFPLVSLGYVWALFWAKLFFDEPLTKAKFAGLGLIVGGSVLLGLGGH